MISTSRLTQWYQLWQRSACDLSYCRLTFL